MDKIILGKDLFGNDILKNPLLRDKFIEPPFSVLNTQNISWQNRKRKWLAIGIKSEVGRKEGLIFGEKSSMRGFDYYRVKEGERRETKEQTSSIFDPALTELMYSWFCPDKGLILDPFAGGSVRGIVANYLGYEYTGIELRKEQVDSNYEQAQKIIPNNKPLWICGDSDKELDNIKERFDFILSCPPYVNLEVYSDLPEDISNMPYNKFREKYMSILRKSIALLKSNCFICLVVSEVRDSNGYYYDFVGDTKRILTICGMKFYNDAVLLNVIGSASMRADRQFSAGKKLVKVHQNILIFKKP